jgi:hypothetical protein
MRHDTKDQIDGGFCFSKAGADEMVVRNYIPWEHIRWCRNQIRDRIDLPGKGTTKLDLQKLERSSGKFVAVAQKAMDGDLRAGMMVETRAKGKIFTTRSQLVPVPFLHKDLLGKDFALLSRIDVEALVKECKGVMVGEFDRILQSKAQAIIKGMVAVDLRGEPTWVASADVAQHPSECALNKSSTHVSRTTSLEQLVNDYGGKIHVLSAGGCLLNNNYSHLGSSIAEHLTSISKPSGTMPSRPCNISLGHQTYLGTRGTKAVQDHPLYGKECPNKHDLWNSSFRNTHKRIALNPFIHSISQEVKQIGDALHKEHFQFINHYLPRDKSCLMDGVCMLRIITMGVLGKILAFANSFHIDKRDKLSDEQQEQLSLVLEELEEGVPPSTIEYIGAYKALSLSRLTVRYYLLDWKRRFGHFDAPTTCGYANLGEIPKNAELYQFFVMDGLGVSLQLGAGVVHSFFTSQASHCTSLGVMVKNNKVYLKDSAYTFFAWGNGSSKERVAASTSRRMKRRRESHRARETRS